MGEVHGGDVGSEAWSEFRSDSIPEDVDGGPVPFYGWMWSENPSILQTATDRPLKEGGECLYE